jgi:hypothetical protein
MTNTDDQPDDDFEQIARKAGAALRRAAPSDGIERLRSARRRQQMVRTSIAVGASALVVVIGLVALRRPSDQSNAPSGSPDTSTTAGSTTTTTEPSTTTTTVSSPPPLKLTYTLSGIEGLAPVGDQTVTDASGYTSLIAAWSTDAGVTDGYLFLYETEAPKANEPEGDMTSVSIEVPDGHAFLVTDNGFESLTSASRIMWWRGDGRLWVVSNFGLTPERLTQLTLAIQPGSGLPYVLPDPAMTFVGFNTAKSYQSVGQDWTIDGVHLTLAATTGGLAQQLADQSPQSVEERTIVGKQGYVITRTNGQINLMWPTDNADRWASLTVSSALADRVDEIAAAIVTA